MNRQLERLKGIIEMKDPRTLQILFDGATQTGKFTKDDVVKVWYEFTPLARVGGDIVQAMMSVLENSDQKSVARQERKQMFLEDENVPAYIKKRGAANFSILSVCEHKYERDIAEMDQSQVGEALTEFGAYNITYIRSVISFLGSYFKWCHANGEPLNEIWLSEDPASVLGFVNLSAAIKNSCYPSVVTVIGKLSSVIPLNEGYAAPVLAVLAWMQFDRSEAVNIRNEEVDMRLKTIRGRKIPDECVDIIDDYFNAYAVPRAALRGVTTKYLDDAGYLVKRVSSEPSGKRYPATAIPNAMMVAGMAYNDILMSSKYHEMYELEQNRALTMRENIRIWGYDGNKKNTKSLLQDRVTEFLAYKDAFFSAR